jgi:hypothetical protein
MKFAGVEITAESVQATRQWFADNAQACIDEAVSGEVRVNDLESYIEWRKQQVVDSLAGKGDHTFTFAQHAHYIQTGECLPLFRS